MLILPIPRKPDWKNPPIVTLAIILACTFIYFVFQSKDEETEHKAIFYYFNSVLPQLELPLYLKERKETAGKAKLSEDEQTTKYNFALLQEMEADAPFMKRLRAGEIITASHPQYLAWSKARNHFDALRAKTSFTERYGFSPANPRPITWFSHMFMHGSPDHLLGNMVFLFIVGYIVEEALGRRRFLFFYILAGLGACLADWLIAPNRVVVGIGASGAIAGVMAMFVVLFGMQRIRFIYWLFVYFNFFRAPAILVLPFWVAKELFSLWFVGGNTNYVAHLGGFFSGAALAGFFRYRHPNVALPNVDAVPLNTEDSDDERVDRVFEKVEAALKRLDFEKALLVLSEARKTIKNDRRLLQRYVNIAKRFPDGVHFHEASRAVFNLPDKTPESDEFVYEVFLDYMKRARPGAQLGRRELVKLTHCMTRMKRFNDANRLVHALMRRDPTYEALPGALFALGRGRVMAGEKEQGQAMLAFLEKNYPYSEEAKLAQQIRRA